MLSLGLSCFIFLFLALAGRATLAVFGYRKSFLRAWLLAPAVGLALLLLGLMLFNQAGLPIRSFGWAWTAAIGLFSAIVLWVKKPVLPGKQALLIGGLLLANLLWTGWPALRYGFNWVSYANDDMANYCLAAERFADKPFFQIPDLVDINLRDYTENYWYMHAADLMRFGSEHLLAWTVSITGQKATSIFMPVILMLGLVQISSAAALVLHKGRHRRWALCAATLLAFSPLFMLGTLYQLIAQVGGLSLLMAMLALITERPHAGGRWHRLRQCGLVGLVAGALCIYYPEVTPFGGLSFIGFLVLSLILDRGQRTAWLQVSLYSTVFTLVFLNYNSLSYIYTLLKQFVSAVRSTDITFSLFPYFLVPTGFANLYGWMPFNLTFQEPVPTISVVAGILTTLFMLYFAVREGLKRTPIAILTCVEFALAYQLFKGGNDFGLYKLAMFMQPGLAAGIAWWLLGRNGRMSKAMPWVMALYFVTTMATGLSYTRASLGLKTGSITELQYASLLGIKTSIPEGATKPASILSTVDNVAAAKFAASELRGNDVAFVARDFFTSIRSDAEFEFRYLHPYYKEIAQSERLSKVRMSEYIHKTFLWNTSFTAPLRGSKAEYLMSPAPQLSLYNKLGKAHGGIPEKLFQFQKLSQTQNYLGFVHSGMGNHYYLGDRRRISIFQQESDPFMEGTVFSGIGRFMLMRIENPTEEFYLRIALTRTPISGHPAWNKQGIIRGEKDYPLPLGGHGAINRIIGPLKPLHHEGASYLAIDFREMGQIPEDRRTGILALYNREVPMDFRRLVGWGRDISAISPAEYAALKRPLQVSRFPADLILADGLEFTGAYEDGWVSPESEWILGPSVAGGSVRLRGAVPDLPGARGTLSISVNDGEPFIATSAPGAFDFRIPVEKAAASTSIKIVFSQANILPGNDGRSVGGMLLSLAVEPPDAAKDVSDFTKAEAAKRPVLGVDQDGWMAAKTTLRLPSGTQAEDLHLSIEYPGWEKPETIGLTLRMPDGSTRTHTLHQGGNELTVSWPDLKGSRLVTMEFDRDFQLPGSDGRRRSARLLKIEALPSAGSPAATP